MSIQSKRQAYLASAPGISDESLSLSSEAAKVGAMYLRLRQKPSSPAANNTHLEVISVTGLEPSDTLSLTQYLQQINLPANLSGEIVFEFTLSKGRVGRIMLEEEASTLKTANVIELIKRHLLKWRPSQSVNSTVVLRLRIQS
ncbi:hypothetical protein MC7420_7630 [Coleofasciculus chthonoplastes PCC 7420]|uniref:Uncharacterized protein n=1 Tax=Coleofasciculus chthonoplastes PCC 7420 TaxID=118168 RepID=B4VIU2_9CYAN|nr:after-VIT domain-containing protein [Coleofasciculus chthonoplastes]EDX77892.1 hypothetical protein MC7420_7630 [Coleofasciculus chthonoplastes PCC 7420]